MQRRDFMKLIGVASGAAVTTSCGVKRGNEKLIPYLIPPEYELKPGEALYYKTTCTECPECCGIEVKLVEKVYGNKHLLCPIKLEGIPSHPINNGALCLRGQASLMRLYHPERLKTPLLQNKRGEFEPVSWSVAYSHILAGLKKTAESNRENLFLSGKTSGAFPKLVTQFCAKIKAQRLPAFEIFSNEPLIQANKRLFNLDQVPEYHLDQADFLLTLSADILETFQNPVRFAQQLSQIKNSPDFCWIHAEPHVSLTGLQATERLTLLPQSEIFLLAFLLKTLQTTNALKNNLPANILAALPDLSIEETSQKTSLSAAQIDKILLKLKTANRPLIIAGGPAIYQPNGSAVTLLTGLLQWAMGMINSTVRFYPQNDTDKTASFKDIQYLLRKLDIARTGVFFVSKFNPAAFLSSQFAFQDKVKKAVLMVGIGDFLDETLKMCDIILPVSHSLESWGDAVAPAGVRNLIQPVLEPLFDTRSEGDILLNLMKFLEPASPEISYQEFVLNEWKNIYTADVLERFLKDGFVQESAAPATANLNLSTLGDFLKQIDWNQHVQKPVLIAAPSIRWFDGRSAVLPLMNEIPDPLTTITYGRWISVGPTVAEKLDIHDGDEITISIGNKWSSLIPAKINPALADEVYVIPFMSGLNLPANMKNGILSMCFSDIKIAKNTGKIDLPILSGSLSQQGRGVIPKPVHLQEGHHAHGDANLYPAHEHKDYRWAMAIDLDKCIGCGACVAACYVENNVPIVGIHEHLKGREMSWIHIEPYYEPDGTVYFLPMLCQHCENAPCEPVCPVYAPYHTEEGLNGQVYNRCVGTRYCSNNCPYKVRRFNWFTPNRPEPLERMLNPDIWPRPKGVMEKCTFCIQRIRIARDRAKDEGRKIQDGEVTPACAQTCPTKAITFGNILDSNSIIYKLAHGEAVFRVFEQLGTQPAIYYLRKKQREVI